MLSKKPKKCITGLHKDISESRSNHDWEKVLPQPMHVRPLKWLQLKLKAEAESVPQKERSPENMWNLPISNEIAVKASSTNCSRVIWTSGCTRHIPGDRTRTYSTIVEKFIVDDYTRFRWVRFLRTKDETPHAIEKFIVKTQRALNATVRFVRTDNGTEFVNKTLDRWFESVGISHKTSVPWSPQQNGVVERRNRTLMEAASYYSYLCASSTLSYGLNCTTGVYTLNRSPLGHHLCCPIPLVNSQRCSGNQNGIVSSHLPQQLSQNALPAVTESLLEPHQITSTDTRILILKQLFESVDSNVDEYEDVPEEQSSVSGEDIVMKLVIELRNHLHLVARLEAIRLSLLTSSQSKHGHLPRWTMKTAFLKRRTE
ncbi:retrovirus-related pol polyprotein from transposon TNT 1-94 [Tanacetum coccineum]